jgi:hypothetical protein
MAAPNNWAPRQAREAALAEIETRLAAEPDSIADQFERACLLSGLNRLDESRDAYLRLLSIDPNHAGALNNLGTLLYETGHRTAARTAYQEAVTRHPEQAMGHVNLGNLLLAERDLENAKIAFESALELNPDHAEAHRGLAQVLAELGQEEAAWTHRDSAYSGRAITVLPYRGRDNPVSVLMIVSAVGGNIPTRHLLDPEIFLTTALVAEFADRTHPLPTHDIIFNTIGDADLCGRALDAAEHLIAHSTRPVVNHPRVVKATGRAVLANRLSGLKGVRAPRILALPRAAYEDGEALVALELRGMGFPLLLRALGFHTGQHFVSVGTPEDLAEAAAALPGRELAAIERLDAKGRDGMFRKYRAMAIDGVLHPLHLAISSKWKVHYFTADMAANPAYRTEEAAFLSNMGGVIGARAMAGLARVAKVLGLDYAGIDFAVGPDGEVLLFEANATMVINPPEPDPIWDYRRAAVHDVLVAAQSMLRSRARRQSS